MKPLKYMFLFLLLHQVVFAQEDSVHTFKIKKSVEPASVDLISCCNWMERAANPAGGDTNTIIIPSGPQYSSSADECNWGGSEVVDLPRPFSTTETGVVRLCYELNDAGKPEKINVMEGFNQNLNRAAKNYLRAMEIKYLEAKMQARAASDRPIRFAISFSFYERP